MKRIRTFLFVVFSLAQSAAAIAAPGILAPLDGSTLSGSSETFTWTGDGTVVDRWRLEVGTVPDGRDLYAQTLGSTVTSMLVSGLPTDGSPVYVNLKWRIDGAVSAISYVYTAADDSVPPPNVAPVVNAGADQAIALPIDTVTLNAVVSDDGLPLDTLNLTWSMLSGPGAVSFLDSTAASTTATFVTPGDYVLQLNASDTLLDTSDQLSVTVYALPVLTTVVVTPVSTVLLVNDTTQFVASGLDQTGQPFAISPTWVATGGSIDSGGFYTAGDVTGQFQATATAESVVGQADIYVVDDLGPWPTNGWEIAVPADMEMEQTLLEEARDYALTGDGSGMITRHGRSVLSWGNTTSTIDVKSVTKSVGALVLGLAIKDNLVALTDLAQTHYPAVGANPASNVDTGWLDEITIGQLVTQTGGFGKSSGYVDILFQPGTTWAYSDGGVNWLGDTLTVAYQSDLLPILQSRILTPLGIPTAQLDWTDSTHRDLLVEGFPRREFNSSVFTSADAMARLGYLVLRNGHWDGQNIIPPTFVDQMRTTVPGVVGLPVGNDLDSKYSGASDHYGLSWWNNVDGSLPNVPTDAYWAWGINDHLILVIPSLDIVASRRGGTAWAGSRTPSYYQVLGPFFDPIVESVSVFGNEAPVVNAGADDSVTLPTDFVNLDGTVSDDGLPDGTLDTTWSLFSGPAAVTFGDSMLEDTTATFTVAGDYTLRLTATDGLSSVSDDVIVTVLAEPDTELPVVTITGPAAGATVNGGVTVTATATDNVGVTEVEFFAAGSSIGVDSTSPYSAVWDSTVETDADYDLTAVARDASGNEGGDSVIVTLDNASVVNLPPTVDAGIDKAITLPTDTVSLSGTASDDGLPGGTLTTTWTAISPPFAVTFVDATALATDATFGGPGTYVLRLTADDGDLNTSADVTITVNSAPPAEEQSFVAIADNIINGSQPNRTVGGGSDIVVHSFGPKVGLVQFDLSSLTGTTISNASFLFRLNALKSDGNIDLQLLDEAWSESTVTYDNQPAFGATVLSVPVTSADVGTVISVDVTGIVQSWADGSQPSQGFRLSTTQGINASIDSRESAGTPMELLVTLVSMPVTVPDVVGLTQANAEAAILGANLIVGTVTTQNDAVVPAGDVISQNPVGGAEVAPASAVALVVSSGPVLVPPTVTLLSPEDGATLTGWLRLSADAADDIGVSSVSFAVDGAEIASMVAPPYELDWDSNTLASGTHSLVVTATDIESNQTSVTATVYVDSLPAQPSAYPMSSIISGIQWAPVATITRDAVGGDNWPVTWADDGDLYTAYGDGFGFEPPSPEKLSLGYSRVTGPASAFVGENIPSPSGEHLGLGPTGKKSSGMLMVEGVLYQWVRNANNNGEQCELAWSTDHGDTWVWSTWQFAEFGYCAFLNYGQNYAGARDSYVYMYTPDTPSAYLETDNVVLTRVLKDQITDRNAYEFFSGLDTFGDPTWSTDITARQPVFTFNGAANRMDVTYQPKLGRYLMTQRSRAQNGGLNQFSIFEAKDPWGPWSVVYFTESWNGVTASSGFGDWGEAQHIPSKWMSADGEEFYLVFSGEDSFSVRRVNLTVVPDTTSPAVSLVSPGDGEAVAGPILVTATASDEYAIESVAFDVDGIFIGELFSPPYSLDWDTGSVATGDHVLTAVATDTSNNQSSSSVTVTVFRDTLFPTIVLDTPAEGSTVAGVVLVSATASDDVAVASVSFAVGATSLGTVTSAPYQVNWDTTADTNGGFEVTATALDTSGNSTGALVNVIVDNPNAPPQVDAGSDQTITLPTDSVSLDGTVSDDGLPVASVTTLWSMLSGPSTVTFADATSVDTTATFGAEGDYVLQLFADDSELTASDTVAVTVESLPDIVPPLITLDAPAEGSTVAGLVLVSATASDDVAVASVSFAVGATSLGTLTSAPFQMNWDTTLHTNGAYQLTATALDTSGNSASALVNVVVTNVNDPPTVDAGVDNAITLPTDTVSLSGTATDDGFPFGSLTTTWTAISPPFAVTFGDATALATDATFGGPGTYVLRLTADDGGLSTSADVTITVNSAPSAEEQSFVPIADNIINGSQPNRTIGGGSDIVVHSFGPKVGLVQFDLSSLTGTTISNASFLFRLNALNSDGNIDLQLLDEAWSESTVTYDNQPAFGATVLSVPVTSADVGTVISVDVTGIVQSWADGSQPSQGFRLSTTQGINASIDSRESAGTPMELLVTADTGTPTTAMPSISPDGATSATPVEVTLATTTPGSSIYYTLDDSTPTTESIFYSAPFTLSASTTVKARAFAPGLNDSVINSAVFTIDVSTGGGLNNYWTLNETVPGSYANDAGGTTGTCSSCPTSIGGLVDMGQSFNGTSNVITVADDSSADWTQNGGFSVEFWVNKSSSCSAREVAVGRYEGGTPMQWSVGCDSGLPFFELADENGTSVTVTGNGAIDDGEWHHVVAVYDGFFNENRLYVDGSLEAAGAAAYTAGFSGAADVTIGELQNGLGNTFLLGIIDEVALHNRAIPTSMINRHYQDGVIGLRDGYVGCSAIVDVMPLGDSITNRLGYRPSLYFDLIDQGYDVNFVGSRTDQASTGSHDRNHEGWSGFATTDIAANLNGWLAGNPPEVILLHAGTNDIGAVSVAEAITGLTSILDTAHAFDPGITVVLGQIINQQIFSQDVVDYNDQMVSLAQTKRAAGHKILLVDHENALIYPDDMLDLEHPTDGGFVKMSGVWFDGMTEFLPACNLAAPTFNSIAGTSGQVATEYRYQSSVLANPDVRFTLLTAPAGMQLHPDTGELRWTPGSAGQYNVDIQVQNSAGSAVQGFILNVP